MKKKFTIDILGSKYKVEIAPYMKYYDKFQEVGGWCDFHDKTIVALDAEDYVKSIDDIPTAKPFKATERILRHEIIHAVLYESGLDGETDFARDEILIDFLAIQFPKIVGIMEKAGLISKKEPACSPNKEVSGEKPEGSEDGIKDTCTSDLSEGI